MFYRNKPTNNMQSFTLYIIWNNQIEYNEKGGARNQHQTWKMLANIYTENLTFNIKMELKKNSVRMWN